MVIWGGCLLWRCELKAICDMLDSLQFLLICVYQFAIPYLTWLSSNLCILFYLSPGVTG